MTIFKFILLGLLGLYLLVGIGVYIFQEKLIFLPEELPRDFKFEFESPFKEHFILMEDGAELNALHFQTENPKGLILYFHGNAGSLERWGNVVDPFVDLGFDVLIMDYRGYGKSTGKRSQKLMLEDADQLYVFAQTISKEKDIIVFGRSLGSSFASHVGGKNKPAKIILETPFYSLGDVAKRVVPIYPQNLLLRFNFNNHSALKKATAPIYIFQGTDDQVVPFESAKKLYGALHRKRIDITVIKGGAHNDLASFDPYWESMHKVLAR